MNLSLAILGLSSDEWAALRLSLWVALVGTGVSLVPGFAVAWLLARRSFPGKALVDAVVHLPLVLPPVVVGYLLLRLLGRGSTLGGWMHDALGIDIAFTWKAAAIASAIMGLPLFVRSARLAIESVDPGVESAARTLGATPLRVLRSITIPLALPGILAGATLAFARSLGEFGATITFAGNIEGRTRTLPSAIYTAAQSPGGDGAAMRLLVLSIVVSLGAILVAEVLHRRALRHRDSRAERSASR